MSGSLEVPRKTGKWLRADIPHTGWRCVEITEGPTVCEMCEVTQVVYAHGMRHEHYPLTLDCGCICAGFMTEDPAVEQLRELLYRWRRSQQDIPTHKLRRKGWRRSSYRKSEGHVFGWSHGGSASPIDDFEVEISNTDGWRFHVYHPWHTEIMTSEEFASDVLAATAGIAWAEMLMANEQWVASECEALVEHRAAATAHREAMFAAIKTRRWSNETASSTIDSGGDRSMFSTT